MAWYRTGTIAVTNGSATVTGSGTAFTTAVLAGDSLQAPDGRLYEVATVVSATQLTLASAYLGATASGQAYAVIPTQAFPTALAQSAAALVGTYGTAKDAVLNGIVPSAGSIAQPTLRRSDDSNTGILFGANDSMSLVTGGLAALFNTAGRWQTPLELWLQSAVSGSQIRYTLSNGDVIAELSIPAAGTQVSGYVSGAVYLRNDGSGGVGLAAAGGPIRFLGNAFSEKLRMLPTGELLLGYTSSNGGYRLQVNSQIFATSSTVATSHGPYKEDVADLSGALDLVESLRPVTFRWKDGAGEVTDPDTGEVLREAHSFPSGTQVGFIAQEVAAALDGRPFASAVCKGNERPAVTKNGVEIAPAEEFMGIAEGNLIPLLVAAVKELSARVQTLESEVAALRAA
jgi:hypothetical protein